MAAAADPGQRGEGGRARRARGAAGVPARLGLRRGPVPRGRAPRPVALPRHGRRGRRRRWPAPASARTTSPTSTSTRASPARCASRSTRSGISEDDPGRAVTQTGGLPYHGGPGSNYMTHALAAMVETLRREPGSYGVTSGVGMHMQKHAYGVWSTDPGAGAAGRPARALRRCRPGRASSSHPRARRPSRPTRCCTAGTAGPSGRCSSAICPAAAAATRSSTAAPPHCRDAEADELIGRTVDPDAGGRDQPRPAALSSRPTGSRTRVVGGLDGCPGGWVLATRPRRHRAGEGFDVTVLHSLEPVVAAAHCRPDGLRRHRHPHRPGRRGSRGPVTWPPAGASARAAARSSRRRHAPCSAPRTYAEACATLAPRLWQGRSRSSCTTSWTRSAPSTRCRRPRLQDQLFEMSPELSFATLTGAPMPANKRTADGPDRPPDAGARVRLRRDRSARRRPARPAQSGTTCSDALVGAWTARRRAAGRQLQLGGDVDAPGLRMEIIA